MASSVLSKFSRVRVLVIGDLVADHYLYGQTERISREAPVLVVRHERDEVKLGGAANCAANVRSLGGRVTALGVVGDDPMGSALRKSFAAAGIAVAAVGGRGVATETKTRVLAGGVNTSRQQMLRIDRGVTGSLPLRVRKALATRLEAALAEADVAVVSDYGAGVLCAETLGVLARHAAAGGRVCVDSRFGLGHFKGFTVCKPNAPELAAFTGLPVSTDDELLVAGRVALERLQCQVLLVTLGRRGLALFEPKRAPALVPAWGPDEVVDVTGAGDTVNAAFSLALGAGASAQQAARLANVAGGLVVMKEGTATVSAAELEKALET